MDDAKSYHLYPSYACNAKCLFCFNPADSRRQMKELPLERIAAELYSMARLGHRHLQILGGDPTVREDLPEICAFAKKAGFLTVTIVTNGIRTSDPKQTRTLSAAGLDLAIISVHGHTDEVHDQIVGVPGALRKVMRSVENFQSEGVSVMISVVSHRLNHAALPLFFRKFVDRGVEHFIVQYLRYHGHMDIPDGRQESLRVRMSDVARSLHAASPVFWDRGLQTPRLNYILPCVLPGYESRIDDLLVEGEEYDGFYLDPDQKNESSLAVCNKGKVKLARCRQCVLFEECPGIEKAYMDVFGNDEIQPLVIRPTPFIGVPL